MTKQGKIFIMICFIAALSGCGGAVVPSVGVGIGLGGPHIGVGVSTGVILPTGGDFGSDTKYKNFYDKNYTALVKKYDSIKGSPNPDMTQVKELRIKMMALREQVNKDWNEIEKRREYIAAFNKKIDPYIISLNNYKNNEQW